MKRQRKQRPTSTVVSLRVTTEQGERLRRRARKLGRTPSETGAMLLDESLRRAEFAFIDFRDSAVGRQAYVLGSRLAVWQVVWLARELDGDVAAVADHLAWPLFKVRAALTYAEAFAPEIDAALDDAGAGAGHGVDGAETRGVLTELRRTLPQLEELAVPPASA